ncbi:peptidylprolyl isomerase [Pseudoalteromonas rhizosphaerae]|uniref:peptidylprolyl isomerase n=1 Tax=Pseudoalteromonas rhizosphaerae TaxID=2518973 RepID=UPI00384E676C
MLKKSCLAAVALILSQTSVANTVEQLTVSDVMSNVSASEWRMVDADNIIKITLPSGAAYIELNPLLAPKHTQNIKKLAREGFYRGLSVYRFVEGFVAQGGDASGKKVINTASKAVPAEFYLATKTALKITELDREDGYAAITGFLNGFAVAQNEAQTQTWQVHCNGIFAMARDNDINSGGTEFYVTLGHGPRYLDRNITVFGRVLEGMAHFNLLSRTETAGEKFNPITDLQVLADISKEDLSQFKVLKTDSNSFKMLIKARQNRSEAWFVETPNYVDVCGMLIPTKRVSELES